jgi:DNA (cytosine-5)-methyltransferase 1
MLYGLDLFSGIGGLALALSQYVKPIAYCEIEPYAQAVLLSRMADGRIPRAPIWPDVTTLSGSMLPPVDIVYGGFPCQDISVAGLGAGLAGERSGLFFEITRLCRDIRPRFVFLENVPVVTLRGLERICLEFTQVGYDSRWTIVSAAELGAPHLRERWFFLAHAKGERCGEAGGFRRDEPTQRPAGCGEEIIPNSKSLRRRKGRPEPDLGRQSVADVDRSELADSASPGLEGWLDTKSAWQALRLSGSGSGSGWPQGIPKPAICRDVDGLQSRVDRLRGLGNAVVPLQAKEAFERLLGLS